MVVGQAIVFTVLIRQLQAVNCLFGNKKRVPSKMTSFVQRNLHFVGGEESLWHVSTGGGGFTQKSISKQRDKMFVRWHMSTGCSWVGPNSSFSPVTVPTFL